ILDQATQVLSAEPNLVYVANAVTKWAARSTTTRISSSGTTSIQDVLALRHEPSAHGSGLKPGTLFEHNNTRGCPYFFTYEATCKFLERNELLGIIRGHAAQHAGHLHHAPKNSYLKVPVSHHNLLRAFPGRLTPHLAMIVVEMLLAVLSVCTEEELENSSSGARIGTDLALSPNEIAARRQQIKNKILA
ncbi:hypothetical protein FIBSPDRAFT_906270, partial [Athelia psychrophila]